MSPRRTCFVPVHSVSSEQIVGGDKVNLPNLCRSPCYEACGWLRVCSNTKLQCHMVQCLHHFENTPIQIYRKFNFPKLKIFILKKSDIFHISAQNINCGDSLEPPRRGGSNEYQQSMLLSRNKTNNVYPCEPQFHYIKVGFKGVKII